MKKKEEERIQNNKGIEWYEYVLVHPALNW